ncbi:uncharacterized protein BHQ10_003491 [Talaromyces amestolkiae]|uniref:C6 zinc finger domain protein n=1 Tax=Talaromyces amestolkiae TaxID=1196081 RepID=A0A364KVC7_TALAM|nr:uncharacterized protein BHQ10_003491 [Talaromyces amestolkiae]RAO67479.1 hypothetical protein BHQ10_003491 [Talaromyces amestolkiae]
MQKNTTRLSGLFTSAFWDDLVFQASVQEPAVRHAVIALSFAQRADVMHRRNSSSGRDERDAEHFTLQQYNKAIGYLRDHHHQQNNAQSTESTRIVLITCMIFTALEFLRGRYRTGFLHLQSGIKLLSENERQRHHQHGEQVSSILLGSKDEAAQIALVDAFTRMSVHCSFYDEQIVHQKVLVSVREGNRTDPCALPTSFASVTEARRVLDRIYGRIQYLKQSYHQQDSDSREESQLHRTQNQILIDLSKWEAARDAFVRRLTPTTHAHIRDRLCFEIMSLYHSMATITASVCLEDDDSESSEMFYDSDAHTRSFARILAGCGELPRQLQLLTAPSLNHDKEKEKHKCEGMGFSMEMGFILPAFYTAVKCRVPRLRRQALYVLRAGLNREAGWDRKVVADIVAEVIRIEEGDFYSSLLSSGYRGVTEEVQDLDPPTQDDLQVPRIDTWRRLRDVRIVLPDDEKGRSTLWFKRRGDGGQWIECSREF